MVRSDRHYRTVRPGEGSEVRTTRESESEAERELQAVRTEVVVPAPAAVAVGRAYIPTWR